MVSSEACRICIIGGGAAGLCILKMLLESREYKAGLWEIRVFEAREQIGGIWLPSSPDAESSTSPLYDTLTTNLPHPIMAFQDYWFPPGTPLFPRAQIVLEYLQGYAKKFNLLKFISLNSRVEEAMWSKGSWEIRLSTGQTHRFDKVVVANGHYNVPRYPTISGLQRWIESGRALHSVTYRNAQPYRDMSVLVIGGGPSGQDISRDVSRVSTVYHSVRGATSEDVGNVKRRGEVVSFGESGTVEFEDGSVSAIDRAILATGYLMSFPFLPQLRQEAMPQIPPMPSHILNSTYNLFPLARHLFPLQGDFPIDSIAFVGLLTRVVPFPIYEAQGMLLAKVFSSPGFIDHAEEVDLILTRYIQLQERFGEDSTDIAKQWHKLPDLEQFSYRRELLDLVGANEEWYPEGWTAEMYLAKMDLRSAWGDLERKGLADAWVKGIGEGGKHEWVSLMRRLLDASKNQQLEYLKVMST